ncbi:hypothetical protein BB560_006772 [Smittium megazygosporum]|uniref:GDP/GTP exchange factor Sec2 N-terminal domain-containing protein n=1 Tax=Smittium megazygosporum TaxID=133381 RepID=A0A2T9Y1Z3_9FUNG|nr:hypothetical protein BB560_007087 [Smittium megazygosporum]PVU86304.1 hypothetical protein BB560_006772 [Smittium megazygosporum]
MENSVEAPISLTRDGIIESLDKISASLESAAEAILISNESMVSTSSLSSTFDSEKPLPIPILSPSTSNNILQGTSNTSNVSSRSQDTLSTSSENSQDPKKHLNSSPETPLDTSSSSPDLLKKIRHLELCLSQERDSNKSNQNKIEEMQISLNLMNDKFVDQVNETAEMAHAKELVEAELEELSRRLFEEANHMVSQEKKLSLQIQQKNDNLERKIQNLQDLLEREKLQSAELKQCLQSMSEETAQNHKKLTSLESLTFQQNPNTDIPGSPTVPNHGPIFDISKSSDMLFLNEFNDFFITASNSGFSRATSSSFLRHIVSEHVEPCLRFGPKPRVSSKHILDAIVANTLQIESTNNQNDSQTSISKKPSISFNSVDSGTNTRSSISSFYRPTITAFGGRTALWERISGTIPPNPNGCQTCGREGPCTYKFLLGQKPNEEWAHIDQPCRDRLVAVCEFYTFIRHLARGHFHSLSANQVFSEIVSLCLSMFYARFGLLSHALLSDPSLSLLSVSYKASFPDSPIHGSPGYNSSYDPYGTGYESPDSPTTPRSNPGYFSNPSLNEDQYNDSVFTRSRFRSQSASVAKNPKLKGSSRASVGHTKSDMIHSQLSKSSTMPETDIFDSSMAPSHISKSSTHPEVDHFLSSPLSSESISEMSKRNSVSNTSLNVGYKKIIPTASVLPNGNQSSSYLSLPSGANFDDISEEDFASGSRAKPPVPEKDTDSGLSINQKEQKEQNDEEIYRNNHRISNSFYSSIMHLA